MVDAVEALGYICINTEVPTCPVVPVRIASSTALNWLDLP